MPNYTLVRHTGYSVGANPQFYRAVETRSVNDKQIEAITAAGGVVFDGYATATDGEEAANYPPDVTGLVPRVTGDFVRVSGIAEEVYIP